MEFLAAHAERQPEKIALRISGGSAEPERFEEWTFARLNAAVLALSARLRTCAPPGERALLLLPSGVEFLVAFLSCLHAGLVAVPAYPPRRNRNRERVLSIHDDAAPALILTTAAGEGMVREALSGSTAQVIVVDLAAGPNGAVIPPLPPVHHADGIAFLQYTSGATGAPKGTVITHANLLANLAAIQALFRHESEHEVVTWLPPYHDMGLIGCLLTPLFRGMTVTLLTPDEFLRKPVRWLQVIASRQAPVSSGAPNFAYQLLAERATDEEIATFDLSRWRIAFNGAEPVQAVTLERFAQRFEKCGFRAEAWLPCYGLAESTLLTTGRRGCMQNRGSDSLIGRERSPSIPHLGAGEGGRAVEVDAGRGHALSRKNSTTPPPSPTPVDGTLGEPSLPRMHDGSGVLILDRAALEQERIEIATTAAEGATVLVSCGLPAKDTTVTIRDPATSTSLDAGRIGEIHVHSPSVARGYWRNEAATAAAFPAEGTLRTGDLGFLHAGELYVTGRVKDLIIIRGRNLHPHDIETCVAAQLPSATGANSIAAFEFAGNGSGSGALGILIEAPRIWVSGLRRSSTFQSRESVAATTPEDSTLENRATTEIASHVRNIRQAVTESFEVTADLIAFVAPGDFPRTSSGKVQRSACREGVMTGSLPVIWRDQLSASPTPRSGDIPVADPARAGGAHFPEEAVGSPLGRAEDLALRATVGGRQGCRPSLPAADSPATADALIRWLRAFAARRLNSQLMDERRTVAPHVVLEFGNHGLFGLQVPREMGGLGLSMKDAYRVVVQLAAIDTTLAKFVGIHNALGVGPILRHGLPALREELIPSMASGRQLGSFASTEATSGSHPKSIQTTAVRSTDGVWTINGRKQWIGLASWAGTITVIAKAHSESGEHRGSVALAVSADATGVSFGPESMTMGVRGIVQVPVLLNDVRVDDSRVLGEAGKGFDVAYDTTRQARMGLAAVCLGAMKRCLQWMTTFIADRDVLGGRLADLPATQTRVRDTICGITAVDTVVFTVAGWTDAGMELPEEVSHICKSTAPEILWEIADRALQMLGGRGYMESNGLPQLFRDARLIRIFEGPTESLNASLGARLRRKSDALCDWLSQMPSGAECAATIRSLSAGEPAKNDVVLGELASNHFLLWMVQQSDREGARDAARWVEKKLRLIEEGNGAAPNDSIQLADVAAKLRDEIGAFDQTLPGEDRNVDPLLQLQPSHTAEPRKRSAVPSMDAADVDGSLIEKLERRLKLFLKSQKLSAPKSISLDVTFSALGVDSLGAAEFAMETEEEFGVRITDETLYDFSTLRQLAGYLQSRLAERSGEQDNGGNRWRRALTAMNERVNRAKEAGLYFYDNPFDSQDGASVMFDGQRCVLLSTYSYLGLAADPSIRAKVEDCIKRLGCGSHGVRIFATGRWHQELEALIAKRLQSKAAVTFGTGFVTNWAVISTLMSAEDTIIADEWIHASLVDGCKGSGATFTFFRHSNLEHLADLLAVPIKGKTLVVIDAVYSMEGDIARVPEISALAHAHGAWLMVDEAHSLGVLGARGLGVQEHFDLAPDAIDIKMGTLSKAIPSAGGYIAGSADLISALRHNVRPFIFSGAPTPPMVAAAMAGFEILLAQPERVQKLHDNIRSFRDGLRRIGLVPPDTGSAIIPLMCRDEATTFAFAKRCLADGLYVTPIVFPAVPQNAPRIRTSITAALSEEDISFALGVIERHRALLASG